jgi:type II secretory pathway component PulM
MNKALKHMIETNQLLQTVLRYLLRCSRREQALLIVTSVLVLLAFLWLGAWQPVQAARHAAELRVMQAEQTLDEVNMLANQLEQLQASPSQQMSTSSLPQSLPQLLSHLAAESGISLSALEPAADNLSAGLRFEAVAMGSLLGWLDQLENQHHIFIEQLNVAPLLDTAGSNAAGLNTADRDQIADSLVNVSMRVRMLTQ